MFSTSKAGTLPIATHGYPASSAEKRPSGRLCGHGEPQAKSPTKAPVCVVEHPNPSSTGAREDHGGGSPRVK